jgi:hypothetical protein
MTSVFVAWFKAQLRDLAARFGWRMRAATAAY